MKHQTVADEVLSRVYGENFTRISQAVHEGDLEKCSAEEAHIYRLLHGIPCESKTLSQVAEIFGVTRERIRQVEARAIRKMQKGKSKEILDELKRIENFCDYSQIQ